MSQRAYSRIENDQSKPTYDQLKRIIDVLNVTMGEIEKWDGQSVFGNYINPANGQLNHARAFTEEERKLYQQLLAQKDTENQLLKEEIAYFKAMIDRLLGSKNTMANS